MKILTPPPPQRCKFPCLSAHNDSLKNIEMKKINIYLYKAKNNQLYQMPSGSVS